MPRAGRARSRGRSVRHAGPTWRRGDGRDPGTRRSGRSGSATIGRSRTTPSRAFSARGGPPRSAGRRPSAIDRSMTARSRSGSIGGFVTCANAWRRWSATGRSTRAWAGVGVSSPMLQSGSWPSTAIVLMSWRRRSASRPARKRRAVGVAIGTADAARPSNGREMDHGSSRRAPLRARREPGRTAQRGGLRVGVLQDAPVARIDEEHLTRPEPPAADGLGRGERDGAGLRRGGHDAVRGDRIGERPEAVPVDEGADRPPVGEREGARSVPRREEARRTVRRTRR